MADNLVDILGFLQPASGNNWSSGIFLDGNAMIIYAFEEPVTLFAEMEKSAFYEQGRIGTDGVRHGNDGYSIGHTTGGWSYKGLYKFLNAQKLLPDVPDQNNLPPAMVGYAGPNTNKQNIIVNINARPIFNRVYANHWGCLRALSKSKSLNYLPTLVVDNVSAYEKLLLQGDVDGANKYEDQLVSELKSLRQSVEDDVKSGKLDKTKIPTCFLPDPGPALPGPPTQTIFGTLNRPPTVDNPNIKLPSQAAKSLDPNVKLDSKDFLKPLDPLDKPLDPLDKLKAAGSDVVSKSTVDTTATVTETNTVSGGGSTIRTAFSSSDPRSRMTQDQLAALPNGAGQTVFTTPGQDSVTTTTSAVNSSISTVQDAAGTSISGTVDSVSSTVSSATSSIKASGSDVVSKLQTDSALKKAIPEVPKIETPAFVKDGLGDNWSPDKFKPETIAGNTKIVDPITGDIGSTEQLAAVDKLKSVTPYIPKPNFPNLPSIAPPANFSNADAAITKLAGGNIDSVSSLNPNAGISSPSTLAKVATGGLVGGGLGAGIGALAGGGKGALIGAAGGAVLGGAAAKLASVKKDMPKPKVPKPANTPRVKKVKLKSKKEARKQMREDQKNPRPPDPADYWPKDRPPDHPTW